MPKPTTVDALLERYPVLLLDAYGVLVDATGALPGAAELIDRLEKSSHPYFVLTNDASRLPENAAAYYRGRGLPIGVDRVITAGSVIAPFLKARSLIGARTVVFGTADSRLYAERAGAEVVEPGEDPEVFLICDEAAPDFLDLLEAFLTDLIRALDRGRSPTLVLANPDLLYPKHDGGFGIAAGSVANVLERAAAERAAGRAIPCFIPLGKPHPPMFEEAARRAGTRAMVMIGDQLGTDIQGARTFGIDAALVTTGIAQWTGQAPERQRPTYLLESLCADRA